MISPGLQNFFTFQSLPEVPTKRADKLYKFYFINLFEKIYIFKDFIFFQTFSFCCFILQIKNNINIPYKIEYFLLPEDLRILNIKKIK